MAKLTDHVMTAEAAEILGVAQNTIRKWAAQGKIRMHRNPAGVQGDLYAISCGYCRCEFREYRDNERR